MGFDPAVLVEALETAIARALAPVVERLRAMEAREPAPGPPGPPGAPGLGFDDAAVDYDGERLITLSWARGDARAERAIKIPAMLYRGVYVPGRLYERGDVVTLAGSLYHANAETTIRPGDGSPAWTLAVKRGRDAERGRDGAR